MKKSLILLITLITMFMFSACSTGVVPPGTTVIIAKTNGESEVKTAGKWTAWGRDRVYFIDGKLKSFMEHMKILCKDKVNMDVDIKWLGSFDISTKEQIQMIKTKVPSVKASVDGDDVYTLSLQNFYKTAMSDIIRSNSRMVISPYVTDKIPEDRDTIEKEIKKRVLVRLDKLDYPVKTTDLLLSNLDFDETVTDQRKEIKKAELEDEKKAALAKANVAEARRAADLAMENGKAKIIEANVEAKANKIRSDSITPQILAMKQWEVLGEAAQSQNNAIWVVPFEALKSSDVLTNMAVKSLKNK